MTTTTLAALFSGDGLPLVLIIAWLSAAAGFTAARHLEERRHAKLARLRREMR